MADLQLLLEAERRGILPPDRKALLDEARRRGLIEGVAVSRPEPEPERTLGGYTKEAFKGLIPGFVGLGETAITGAASLLPERAEQAVRKPVEEFATGVRETFAPAPGYEDTLVRKISEGVGSTVPFLGLGLLGAAGRIGAAGLAVSTGAGEARQRAEEAEATEGQRGAATALGMIPGALEALPPIRILRRFGFGDEAIKEVAGLVPALGRIAKSGGEEALQEASSQVLQNLIAKGVYAPDEAVFGGVGEAATVGGGAGAVISAIAELALGRRLRSSEAAGREAPPETQEETTEEAPPTEPPVVEEEVERPPVTPFVERPEQEAMFREEAAEPVVEEEAAAPTPAPDLRNLALEAIKTTPTIKAISEATGLNQPKAAAIMRGFVDEGLVERKGSRFKLVEPKAAETATLSPVPPTETVTPTTPPEASRGTEPVTSEIVGGAGARGAKLPVSRAPAKGRGPAGVGTKGLGVPSAPAARVDEREEGVKPALKKARYKEEGEPYDQGISFNYGNRHFELGAAAGMFSRPILTVTNKNGDRIGDHYANNERRQVDARVGDASQIGQYDLPPDIANAINDYLFSYSKGKEAVTAAGRKIADSINSEMAKYEPAARVDEREEAAKPALKAAKAAGVEVQRAAPKLDLGTKKFMLDKKGDRDALTQIADLMSQEAPSEQEVIDYADSQLNPFGTSRETIKGKPGVNAKRLAKMLGPQLYGNPTNMGPVAIKEVLQNSFDSIKGMIDANELKKGRINVEVDKNSRTIEMTDNGRGMTPELLGTKFLEIAGTGKDATTPSGGFGIAKMLFLYGNKGIRVVSMRDGKVSEMVTDGDTLFDALENPDSAPDIFIRKPTEEDNALFPDGHGTYISLQIPEDYEDPTTGDRKEIEFPSYISNVPGLKYSPLFSDIDVNFTDKRYSITDEIDIGSKFPYDKFTEFANVKFPWGNARIYVAPKEDSYGSNLYVLSNGLYQFSQSIKKNPLELFGENVPYEFYVDIKPTVKPADAGYPFTFNRQDFTEQAKKDYGKVFNYINALYAYESLSQEAKSFGSIQYFDSSGNPDTPIEIKPSAPPAQTAFGGIQQGDKVTVQDGKLFVRGKELPELTSEQLKAGIPSSKELVVDPAMIRPESVMLHDNVQFKNTGQDFSSYMREHFGSAYDNFVYEVGDIFQKLRQEVSAVLDYPGLMNEAIGVSVDQEYRGVSIRVPFSGSFVNPFAAESTDTIESALGTYGTMIHELAHYKIRSHNADFPAEMQKIIYKLRAKEYKGVGQFDALERRLVNIFSANQNIVNEGWRVVNEGRRNGSIEPRGNRFQDGSREDIRKSKSKRVPSGKRGPSGTGRAGQLVQPKPVSGAGPTQAGRPSGAAPSILTQRPTTPRQVKQAVQSTLNSVTQSFMNRPNYSSSLAKKVVDALGNVPLNLRKAQFAIYSMPQMQQLLSTVLPYVGVLEKTNGLRAAQTSSGLDRVAKNQTRWQEIIKRHPRAKWEKLKQVATLGTLYQVDPTSVVAKQIHNAVRSGAKKVASLTPVEKVQYEIAAMYYSLPSDLRSILISEDGKSGIVPEYRKYRQQKFDALVKNWAKQGIPTNVIDKLRQEFNDPKNNLSFYIPLRRDQGVYWLKYVDANGNAVSKLFSNPVERNAFKQQIEAQGATQIVETSRYSDIKGERAGKPPTGFLGEIVKLLETSLPSTMGAGKNVIISEVYDIFLDYMPQNTLRQELSSRQVLDLGAGLKQFGVFGFNEDFLETYVEEAPRIVYQLNNLRWVLPIEDVMKKLAEQRDKYVGNYGSRAFMQGKLDIPPEQLNEAFDSIRKRVDFGYSPTYAPWVYNIATTNYIFSIAANVSSALINTTTIPMLTIPVLAAKYGVKPTLSAISRASAMFAKAPTEGGIKIGGKRIGDWSASHGATGEYKQFFKSLIDRGVIGAVAEQELLQAQRVQLSGYDSLGDKVNYLAGYVFKNSERFNRETTLLASFMLAREKGKNFNAALEEAIADNNAVNGAVLPASDSRLYQTDLGRVLLTFRKYILNASILIAGTFKEAVAAVEPNNQQQKLLRTVARRRLLGIYAGTYMVAGIGGMPLFGAAEMLAALMMGDDDEPYDLQQEVMESLGELGLNGPVNALINLDVASRTGFTDVLWRDDPKRLAEVGYITFGLEKLAGPTYSTLMNWQRGFGLMAEGEIWRGSEALLPAAARNALKATRYATEGALTKNGVPIEEDIGAWNNTMQIFGFAPADLATTQARVGAEYQTSQKLRQRRTALLTQLYAAVSAGNGDAVRDAYKSIADFNRANPTIMIEFDTIERSFKERDRRNAESIDGLYLEKNLRQATIPYVSPRD